LGHLVVKLNDQAFKPVGFFAEVFLKLPFLIPQFNNVALKPDQFFFRACP
jgi:hypothetical protein